MTEWFPGLPLNTKDMIEPFWAVMAGGMNWSWPPRVDKSPPTVTCKESLQDVLDDLRITQEFHNSIQVPLRVDCLATYTDIGWLKVYIGTGSFCDSCEHFYKGNIPDRPVSTMLPDPVNRTVS